MLKKCGSIALIAALLLIFWLGQQSAVQDQHTGRQTIPASQPDVQNLPAPVALPAHDAVHGSKPLPDFLPHEAKTSLDLIAHGGPFPHRQDGAVFQNREQLEDLLTQAENAGVFFVTGSDLEAIELAAQHNDAYYCAIDLQNCHSKTQLLEALSQGLNFPPSFGKNWDALADYLSDLSWLASEAFVICFANSHHYRDTHEEDFKTLVEILEEASTNWSEQQSPFWAFLSLPDEEFEQMQV